MCTIDVQRTVQTLRVRSMGTSPRYVVLFSLCSLGTGLEHYRLPPSPPYADNRLVRDNSDSLTLRLIFIIFIVHVVNPRAPAISLASKTRTWHSCMAHRRRSSRQIFSSTCRATSRCEPPCSSFSSSTRGGLLHYPMLPVFFR
jgi:hypothetical protein